jgi:microcystin-dependent protein
MSDQYLGEIRIFASNTIPPGWMPCDGSLLPIAAYTALFSLLGTYYGGNGTNTFALPNLRGSAALGAGEGKGLTPYYIGETGGEATVTLNLDEIAAHSHFPSANAAGTLGPPGGALWGNPGTVRPAPNFFASKVSTPVLMNKAAIGTTGGGMPHNNLMPYNTFVFCISLDGVFPSRH